MNDKDKIIQVLTKATIATEIMKLADSMYEKRGLPNRTAAVLIYFNLVEWLLGFLVRQLQLNIPEKKFIEMPLGGKISLLKKEQFNHKTELLDILEKFNKLRIKIVHNMVETISDKQMENSIDEVKKLFDGLNKYLVLIMKSYGFIKVG